MRMIQFFEGNREEDGHTLSHLDFGVTETDCQIRNHSTGKWNIAQAVPAMAQMVEITSTLGKNHNGEGFL